MPEEQLPPLSSEYSKMDYFEAARWVEQRLLWSHPAQKTPRKDLATYLKCALQDRECQLRDALAENARLRAELAKAS